MTRKFKDNNKGLLDKERFKRFHKKENFLLRKMSIEKGIKIMEGLLDSGLINEFRRAQRKLS